MKKQPKKFPLTGTTPEKGNEFNDLITNVTGIHYLGGEQIIIGDTAQNHIEITGNSVQFIDQSAPVPTAATITGNVWQIGTETRLTSGQLLLGNPDDNELLVELTSAELNIVNFEEETRSFIDASGIVTTGAFVLKSFDATQPTTYIYMKGTKLVLRRTDGTGYKFLDLDGETTTWQYSITEP